ncbi:MAG: hypothetical protein R6V20_07415 [Desulfobia sp.]
MNNILPDKISRQLAELYRDMEYAYDEIAAELGFSCTGCADNCCDSYFVHHTYIEWAYLWEGLNLLDRARLGKIVERAHNYVRASERAWLRDKRPSIICPLNDEGLCTLYSHRLMICRLHGVPASMTRPDGKILEFPGCDRCQQMVGEMEDPPRLDRTAVLQRLAGLEMDLLGPRRYVLPRVKKSIAEMIVHGPPLYLNREFRAENYDSQKP